MIEIITILSLCMSGCFVLIGATGLGFNIARAKYLDKKNNVGNFSIVWTSNGSTLKFRRALYWVSKMSNPDKVSELIVPEEFGEFKQNRTLILPKPYEKTEIIFGKSKGYTMINDVNGEPTSIEVGFSTKNELKEFINFITKVPIPQMIALTEMIRTNKVKNLIVDNDNFYQVISRLTEKDLLNLSLISKHKFSKSGIFTKTSYSGNFLLTSDEILKLRKFANEIIKSEIPKLTKENKNEYIKLFNFCKNIL